MAQNEVAVPRTPVCSGGRPASMLVRDGQQTGQMVYALVKCVPSLASLSSTGVRMIWLPASPRASQRCWSEMIISRLSLSVGAEAVPATALNAAATTRQLVALILHRIELGAGTEPKAWG